jgi:hypothetical protein
MYEAVHLENLWDFGILIFSRSDSVKGPHSKVRVHRADSEKNNGSKLSRGRPGKVNITDFAFV